MQFDLWDTETSNYYGRFEDETKVLGLVRKLINHYGESYADDLGLGRVTNDGTILDPLSGEALIARVNEALGHPEPERRGVLIASAVQTRRFNWSIEPFAAAANRVRRHVGETGHRRTERS